MDEFAAIALLKQGNLHGLEILVEHYQEKARRVSFLICHDPALADDVVQTAFVQAYDHIQQFDATRPFGPWFLRSVANATLMAVRRPAALSLDSVPGDSASLTDAESNGADRIAAAETREAIWAALAQLTPPQRAVIVMRYYLDMSEQEIAQALACPPGTIRRRSHDARLRLRVLLPAWVRGT